MEDEHYGIDPEHGHPRAIELIPDDFFWSNFDELGPFGSDEGDTALSEFREWRTDNPSTPLKDCIIWTVESVGEMNIADYNDDLTDVKTIQQQIDDPDFDDQHFIFTLDTSVIATAFGQLADEGKIDESAKPYTARALKRLATWARLESDDWPHADDFIKNLKRLEEVLAVV